jgi:hypothetical protein
VFLQLVLLKLGAVQKTVKLLWVAYLSFLVKLFVKFATLPTYGVLKWIGDKLSLI